MKQKIILLLIRLARFFRKEDTVAPELSTIEPNAIKTGRIYTHYGRVLHARRNPQQVTTHYFLQGKELTKEEYQRLIDTMFVTGIYYDIQMQYKGQFCQQCACELYGLPCRCDFSSGPFSGYYELIHTRKQYSTQPYKPAKQPLI